MTFQLFAQRKVGMIDVNYTKPFLSMDSKGEIADASIYELGIGWGGNGLKPYFAFTLGYLRIGDELKSIDDINLVYQSLFYGGKIGVRPFAKTFNARFQPILQFGVKTTFKIESTNEETQQKEQLFSNGFTKNYTPPDITFISSGAGFEFFIANKTSFTTMLNYDFIYINKYKQSNISATGGLRIYF